MNDRKKQIRHIAAKTGKRHRGAANVVDREAVARASVTGGEDQRVHKRKCDICGEQITAPEDAQLISDYFGKDLRGLYASESGSDVADWTKLDRAAVRRLRSGPLGSFVDAVAIGYLTQFSDFYEPDGPSTNGEILGRIFNQATDKDWRLLEVLSRFPEHRHVWLLLHDKCLPSDIGGYCIALTRIDRPHEAVSWAMHLNEKNWWDAKGWTEVLESLYGRDPVP